MKAIAGNLLRNSWGGFDLDFSTLVKTRRSVRKFTTEPVSRQDILDILALAIEAPSAGNEQMWHFRVIQSDKIKNDMAKIISDKLGELADKTGTSQERVTPVIRAATLFTGAPVVIAVTTAPYRSQADKMLQASGMSEEAIDLLRARPDLQSMGSVIQTLLLAAWEKGFGTCWMCGPMIARPELEQFLGIEQPQSLTAMVAIGKPGIVPGSRGRKSVEQVTVFMD